MSKSARGFTLIELLVVISIIAILSTIGIVTYSNAQKSARDAKRRADIDEIAKALETNKIPGGVYQSITANSFVSSSVPHDPLTADAHSYISNRCGTNMASPVSPDPACWYCLKAPAGANYCVYATDDYVDNANKFQNGAKPAQTSWSVCANLESGDYYCKSSAQ